MTGVAHLVERTVVDLICAREAFEPESLSAEIGGESLPVLTWRMSDSWSDWDAKRLAAAARRNITLGGGPFGDAAGYLQIVRDALHRHGAQCPVTDAYSAALGTVAPGQGPGRP